MLNHTRKQAKTFYYENQLAVPRSVLISTRKDGCFIGHQCTQSNKKKKMKQKQGKFTIMLPGGGKGGVAFKVITMEFMTQSVRVEIYRVLWQICLYTL